MDEEVIVEGCDVEEYGFVVEEEFGEEGEVLREELVLFAVDFTNGVQVARVDWSAGRWGETTRTDVRQELLACWECV